MSNLQKYKQRIAKNKALAKNILRTTEKVFMKKGDLKTKCSGIERKFNGVIQLKDVLPPLFYKYYVSCCPY